MKIQFASDLHLEFIMNKAYIEKYPLEAEGDILILAGDIIPFNMMHAADNFFDYVSDHFKITYWIPGNHEYYRSDINERSGSFQEQIRDNVVLLNNKSIEYHDYKIIFSTLWTSIGDQYANDIKRGMNDFRFGFSNSAIFNEFLSVILTAKVISTNLRYILYFSVGK